MMETSDAVSLALESGEIGGFRREQGLGPASWSPWRRSRAPWRRERAHGRHRGGEGRTREIVEERGR